MKLKFRADAKDWLIFVIFAVFLLYFVSIVVGNLAALSNGSDLPALNPFTSFGSQAILIMIVYIMMLIVVVSSVSSHFFDMEKGIGISTSSKKDKGFSRWSTDKEIKEDKTLEKIIPKDYNSESGGIPILNNGKEIWVDNGEYHSIIIGSTGSGKTEMLVHPMVKTLAKHNESMIITDPKGEIYEKNALELIERGYNIVLLNFREPQKGNCWNPLSLPYQLYKSGDPDKANELLDDLAKNILYDESSKGQDPFWENTSADYFAGLSLALFDDAKEEEINLNSINLMTTVGEEKMGGTTYMKEYFSDKDQSSPAYVNVASTLMAPTDTKGSILAVFKQRIKLFSSRENLSEMLSHSDFNMEDIGRKKTAVFIVIQDEKKTYHSLVTIFLKQCYETLIRVAQESGGKLPHRTNFILDEFANMPPLKDVTTMVTAARSRKIRFNFIIQNFSQLNEVYGKENAETIKGNCGNIIYLISSELAALEEISKMCGEVKSKKDDKTSSTPLITVSDLQRMKFGSMVLLRTRCMPFKTTLTPNFEMVKQDLWGKNYGLADYPKREKGIVSIFDLKKHVEEKRQKKIEDMLGGKGLDSKPDMNPRTSTRDMPFGGRPLPTPDKDFNVDEIVKRIDAKIAELEAEEKAEKEEQARKSKGITDNKENIEVKTIEEKTIEEKVNKVQKPIIKEELKNDIVETKTISDVTDDQFFDDFFNDEE